jgi:chromosome segregation ATPase
MEDSLQNSEISNKDSLLRKCRDTIKILQEELEHSQRTLHEYDRKLKDSLQMQVSYQQELEEKSYQLRVTTQENKEIVSKYEELLEKALKVQQDNEDLSYNLEISQKRLKDLEMSSEKSNYLVQDFKVELQAKSEIIKQWNGTMIDLEDKMKLMSEENRLIKAEYEKLSNLKRELEKKLKNLEEEKTVIFKSFQETKEKLAVSKHELENREKLYMEQHRTLEDTKSRSVALEISLSEVAAKAKISQEEVKSHKVKLESTERLIKDLTAKYNSEMERMNVTLENKSNFFNKEDSRKVSLITRLEHDLKFVKEELENLTSIDSLLQARYRDLLEKSAKRKEKIKELEMENSKLNQSLLRFDEKLKNIENSYLNEAKNLKMENSNLQAKIKKIEENFQQKVESLNQEFVKKNDLLNEENSRIKNEMIKNQAELSNLIRNRDEEVLMLNDDRNKLQLALAELESKVLGLSRNLETSVADCWRLSGEIVKINEIKKEEMEKLGDFYKLQLLRKNEEFNLQSEKYSERLKSKLSNFYEKASTLKESLKREFDSLEYLCQSYSTKSEFSSILFRLQSLLCNFII